MIASKYQLLTPGINDQKRPVSFGGVDPTSSLKSGAISQKLVPAKSYPCYQNPSYMMMIMDM